jgi:hypothetical protein
VPALPGAAWDRRFRLDASAAPPPGATLGALGAAAATLRRHSDLPSAVLAALPAIRVHGVLAAVPQIGYPDVETCARMAVLFCPASPAAGAPFGVACQGMPSGQTSPMLRGAEDAAA